MKCINCDIDITSEGTKPKKFCSDRCRMAFKRNTKRTNEQEETNKRTHTNEQNRANEQKRTEQTNKIQQTNKANEQDKSTILETIKQSLPLKTIKPIYRDEIIAPGNNECFFCRRDDNRTYNAVRRIVYIKNGVESYPYACNKHSPAMGEELIEA